MIEQGGGGAILSVIASYAWTGGPGTIHSAAAKAGIVVAGPGRLRSSRPTGIRAELHLPRADGHRGRRPGALADGGGPEARGRHGPGGRLATPELVVGDDGAVYSYADYITGETLTIGRRALARAGFLHARARQDPALGLSRRRPVQIRLFAFEGGRVADSDGRTQRVGREMELQESPARRDSGAGVLHVGLGTRRWPRMTWIADPT